MNITAFGIGIVMQLLVMGLLMGVFGAPNWGAFGFGVVSYWLAFHHFSENPL